MDSEFMTAIAGGLGDRGIRVIRFEFSYMAGRRTGGPKKPPPKAETMMSFFCDLVAATPAPGRVFIGGKSMGGRIASLIADELFAADQVGGVICLGYPFHPPGKPERLRTAHLEGLQAPCLICQGERDPFGTREEVAGYDLSGAISLEWLHDGNHDLTPRKSSGRTAAQNREAVVSAITEFIGNPAGA